MAPSTFSRYYQILGIPEHASLEMLKQAYRQKAKQLHPDKNKAPEAHQDFILLNEAYDYLLQSRSAKRPPAPAANVAQAGFAPEWYRQERIRARQRAQAYAQMQYEEFLQSDQYKLSSSWNTIVAHGYFFFAIAVLGVLPVVATLLYGRNGFFVSLLVMALTSPLSIDAIRSKPDLDFSMLGRALLYVMQTNSFQASGVTAINLLLLLKVGLQTLLSPAVLLGSFAAVMLAVHALTKWVGYLKTRFRRYCYVYCIAPLVLNLVLLVNYTLSRHPVQETYLFSQVREQTRRGTQRSTLIELQDYHYDAYPGIRVFWSYQAMNGHDHITYTFRQGLLGLRVMTDHVFHDGEEKAVNSPENENAGP